MSEKDLCVECHEYYCVKYGAGVFFRPDQHCHHEPKWREKEKCWCEYSRRKRTSGVLGDIDYFEITFCPVCGKKLDQ